VRRIIGGPELNGWMAFWKALTIFSLVAYGILVLVVAVGGLADIASMFSSLDRQHQQSGAKPGRETPS